jgi:signal transduction histidine kinase
MKSLLEPTFLESAQADLSPKVLVIDDDAGTRSNLRDILALDDYHVDTAGTVAEALDRKDWNYFAILMDRKLPDGMADEVLPKLRLLAPTAEILIVTGFADLESSIAALRQGASDYILKPINPDALRVSLARAVERRRLAQRLLQAERLAGIGQMMTSLAHESGNALARIQSNLDMLALELEDRPGALEHVRNIQKAQDDLKQLYDDMRGYAAPIKLERDRWDLSKIWQQAWKNVHRLHQERKSSLAAEPGGIDLECNADPFRLEQVFRNIFENSLAACRDPVRVTIRCSEATVNGQAPAVCLSIRDNGPGLSPEQRKRIFEPFFTTKSKGTGLGMAIVKRIMEAHGGQIAVGAEGPGAEIVLILPRKPS